jgi:hypothetical protein
VRAELKRMYLETALFVCGWTPFVCHYIMLKMVVVISILDGNVNFGVELFTQTAPQSFHNNALAHKPSNSWMSMISFQKSRPDRAVTSEARETSRRIKTYYSIHTAGTPCEPYPSSEMEKYHDCYEP